MAFLGFCTMDNETISFKLSDLLKVNFLKNDFLLSNFSKIEDILDCLKLNILAVAASFV